MDIKFLESLIKVVETGSIAAAARAQGLTATAISQRVRTLETELECALLSRVGHKAVPTEACTNLLPKARQLVLDSHTLRNEAQPNALYGTLRLGAVSTALTDYIPDIVNTFTQHAPDAKLIVTPGTSASLYEQLIKQEIDAALLVEPNFQPPKQIHTTAIADQPLCIISHQSARAEPLQHIINDYPLILYDRNSWGGQVAWRWVLQQTPSPTTLCELDALETIAIMTEQGLGFSVVPHWTDLTKRYQIAIHPLPENQQFTRTLTLYSHRASAVQRLIQLCSNRLIEIKD